MKIVYGAGNRIGASFQLYDFIQHTQHDVKIAGYSSLRNVFNHFEWTLDPIHIRPELLERLRLDIETAEPDLIISDCENFTASIAKELKVPLMKCSPLHLLDGVKWTVGQQRYRKSIERLRYPLRELPETETTFIYAPYSNTQAELKPGFEWIQPYSRILAGSGSDVLVIVEEKERADELTKIAMPLSGRIISRTDPEYECLLGESGFVLCSGDSTTVSDLIRNKKRFCIAPNVKNSEQILNALMCDNYGLGKDMGQIELLGRIGTDDLEKAIEQAGDSDQYVIAGNLFHERIDNGTLCSL